MVDVYKNKPGESDRWGTDGCATPPGACVST